MMTRLRKKQYDSDMAAQISPYKTQFMNSRLLIVDERLNVRKGGVLYH
jgi:hypothetical protein